MKKEKEGGGEEGEKEKLFFFYDSYSFAVTLRFLTQFEFIMCIVME